MSTKNKIEQICDTRNLNLQQQQQLVCTAVFAAGKILSQVKQKLTY